MKEKQYVVKVLKDALTGEACKPSLLRTKSLNGVFGEVLYSGTKTGARRVIANLTVNPN